jgi:hypothetical protein
MQQSFHRSIRALLLTLACIVIPLNGVWADDVPLTKDQIKAFLQNAKVIKEKGTNKGVTHPWRLTLTDGTITHDASFQAIDEHTPAKKFDSGKLEFGFVDSYKYNIALTNSLSFWEWTTWCRCTWSADGEVIPGQLVGGSR